MSNPVEEHIKNCPACSGNPDVVFNVFEPEFIQSLSEEEKDRIREVYDPVFWAERNCGFSDPHGFHSRKSSPKIISFIEEDNLILEEYGAKWEDFKKELSLYPGGYPYQAKMTGCNYPLKVSRSGRRTGKSFAGSVRILHKCLMNANYNVVIFTPNISQLYYIMGDAQKDGYIPWLMKGNPALEESVQAYRLNPFPKIIFKNGSSISGYVSGSTAARGADADFLMVDEASFLTQDDIGMVIGIMAKNPNVEIWVSSTPQGQADWFKEKTGDPIYKHYYFPCIFNPEWDIPNPITKQRMEDTLRNESPTEGHYNREALALFDTGGTGVFQTNYIRRATDEASYEESIFKYNPAWQYVAGIDWNSSRHGTRISIIGTPDLKRFYVVNMDCVNTINWTQTMAINKLFDLNREWHFKAVYADAGFGATQKENIQLRAFGSTDFDDKKLLNNVHFVDLGSSIDTIDIFTKLKVPKPMKGFMVNTAIRFFEKGEITVPKKFEKLVQQLENYQILRVTEKGQVVYGPPKGLEVSVGDHDLDAFMFALLGFTMEYSPLIKRNEAAMGRTMKQPDIQRLEANKDKLQDIKLPELPPSRDITDRTTKNNQKEIEDQDGMNAANKNTLARIKSQPFRFVQRKQFKSSRASF